MRRGPEDVRRKRREHTRSQRLRDLKNVAHGHDRSAHDTASRETENGIFWRGMLWVQGTMLRLPEWLDRSHQP